MAYIADTNDDDIKKQQQQGINTSGVVGANAAAGPTTSGSSPADTKAPTSTGFVNLQQYLDANQGTGAKLASDATKDLSNQVTQYGQKATDTVNGAKGSFDAASRTDEANKIKSGLGTDANGTYSQASQYLNSGYSGPQASDYTGTLAADRDTLNGQLNNVDKQGTQQDLLRNAYGKNGTYSNGFSQLDSFLMNGQQAGRDVLGQVKGKTADVNGAYSGAENSLNDMQQTAQNNLASNQASIRSAAKSNEQNILNAGNQAVTAKNGTINRNNIGTANASLGDVLSGKQHVDLQALSQLADEQYNPDWDKKTFNAGTAKPAEELSKTTPSTPVGTNASGMHFNVPLLGGFTIPNIPSGLPTNGGNYPQQAANYAENAVNAAAKAAQNPVGTVQHGVSSAGSGLKKAGKKYGIG